MINIALTNFGIPVFLMILDAVSFVAALVLAYYGARLFYHMRMGKLEKSWKLMTAGAIIFSLGFLSLAIQDLSPAYGLVYIVSDYFGTILSTIGIVLLVFGMRSHYSVWARKNIYRGRDELLRARHDEEADSSY